MKNRIKELRKVLNLNQTEFGTRIGLKQSAVTAYETGVRNPLDTVITSICREFNVSEEWLRTGSGEMFAQKKGFSFDDYIKQRNLSDIDVQILKVFAELQPESRQDIIKNLQKIMFYIQEQDNADVPDTPEELVQQYQNPKAE